MRDFWAALHQAEAADANGKTLSRLSQTLNDAFIVILLTAQRSGEVADAMAGRGANDRLVDDSGKRL